MKHKYVLSMLHDQGNAQITDGEKEKKKKQTKGYNGGLSVTLYHH